MKLNRVVLAVFAITSYIFLAGQNSCDRNVFESPAPGPTRYPIVLAHGFGGFKEILGIEYFWGVKDDLEALGYKVYVTQVDMFNTIEVRGTQLAGQIDKILAESGASKVNIIAHSMGGLDARYAITHLGYGDRVASLTTISTPHHGTAIADIALGLMSGPVEDALDVLSWLAGCTVDGMDYEECRQSAIAGAQNLTIDYVSGTFNPATPDDPRVKYYSYAGITGWGSIDIVDPLLLVPYQILFEVEGQNDGLVSVQSAQWGNFVKTVHADHLDEIGQIMGSTQGFHHYKFYEEIAEMLKNQGF
jgi:triacylglycerol esterase/lipase EstA (alpha/beta hydrolase family)